MHYPEWLSNIVLVKKINGKWRMCMDFTDLNKTCPNDSFPLTRIDIIVDTTLVHKFLSFIDAYSNYNQIRMNKTDEEKMTFIMNRGLYYCRVMPFRLKNARATYQRLIYRMFKHQIGKTMEVYMDNLLVKSKKAAQHLIDLRESFAVLRKYKMKLNLAKCAFRVNSGKFMGFIVSERGIEANTEKIEAILNMAPP